MSFFQSFCFQSLDLYIFSEFLKLVLTITKIFLQMSDETTLLQHWHCAKQITNSHIDFSPFSARLLILSTNHSFWSWVFISPLPFPLSYEYLSHDSQPLYPTISTISSTLLAELSEFLSLPPSFRSQWRHSSSQC